MLHVAQTSALLHPAVCVQQPTLSSVPLSEDLAQKHLREKVTYDQQKVLHVETPTACTVRKTYQTSSTLLLYFTACWARYQLSWLAKMGTSPMSPTQCHNWELFHINLTLKGQNLRDQASITERMFTLILLSFSFFSPLFFFNTSTEIFLSYGAVFPFLIHKMIVLIRTKQLNAYLAGLFIWKQYRANICVSGGKNRQMSKKSMQTKNLNNDRHSFEDALKIRAEMSMSLVLCCHDQVLNCYEFSSHNFILLCLI